MEDLHCDEIAAVVDRAVDALLQAAEIQAPPVDAIRLARRHLNMFVCLDRQQPQRGRAQRAAGLRQIYVRPEPTAERHQWTVAHEIGEHVKPALLQCLAIDPAQVRAMGGESLANLFAHRLLVPTCWLKTDAPALAYDLLELKKRFTTASHEVIAWRLLDLPEPCILTVVDNNHIHRRRSNAWPVRKKLEAAEEKCQRYVHSYGRPYFLQEEGWTVHGWPIHRAGWKREILRSVVEIGEW